MKKSALLRNLLLALVGLAFVAGCNDGGPSTRVFVKKPTGQRTRIAVLPFDNVSRDPDAGRVITNTVVTYLLSTGGFDVLEPGVVYSALQSESIRLTEGITAETCQKLQPRLNVDAYVIGVVEEYGEVRVGSDSYPSISFSARLVDARAADIVWAATISKTGTEGVKLFDIGRISSLGKLSKLAVKAMAESLMKSRGDILASIGSSGAPTHAVTTPVQPQENGDAGHGTQPVVQATDPGQTPKYLDETATYGEKELVALLKDIGDAKLGEVTYKKHYHDAIDTRYQLGSSGKFVELRLLDYRNKATAEKFIQHYHTGEQQGAFESLPAFTGQSSFGYYHVDVAVGRFGLFLSGPQDLKGEIEKLGSGIIASLK